MFRNNVEEEEKAEEEEDEEKEEEEEVKEVVGKLKHTQTVKKEPFIKEFIKRFLAEIKKM